LTSEPDWVAEAVGTLLAHQKFDFSVNNRACTLSLSVDGLACLVAHGLVEEDRTICL